MLYCGYDNDFSDNMILFDDELHLVSQPKKDGQIWGTLPEGWKEGDTFTLVINPNGRVALLKVNSA